MLKTETYFRDPYQSIEDVRSIVGPILDASTLQKVADCPRKYEIAVEERLTKDDLSLAMAAGTAVHFGLDYYYSLSDPDPLHEKEAIELMASKYNSFEIDITQVEKHTHLTERHLRGCMANYFQIWNRQRIETLTPVGPFDISDLNLDQVLAAKFQLNPDGKIILGESSLVMEFPVDDSTLVLAGKPDLPVANQVGGVYVMDHKTTSGYLSTWWAKSHETSNKLRGYMAMIGSLLDTQVAGAVINGIYVGKYANNPDSSATKAERYEFDFSPGHVDEALRNQLAWRQTIDRYRDDDFFPQGCAYGGCSFPDICRREPQTRDEVKTRDYVHNDHTFWDL